MNTAPCLLKEPCYSERLESLRKQKERDTRAKQELKGFMDSDDSGSLLPPPDRTKLVETMSSSGMPIRDALLAGIDIEENGSAGGFFGPRLCGANFRRLLESHPVCIDPSSSLAGAYMTSFNSYRRQRWPEHLSYSHLEPEISRYRLVHAIGGLQHFCQDLTIGLELGWGGLLDRIRKYRLLHRGREDFYAGLEHIVLGMQNWIGRSSREAERLALLHPELASNLREMADINDRLRTSPPRTFREACQWILWFQMAARMYNGSGSLGRLDLLLEPYYRRDTAAGNLTDEEAVFHIACLLLRDNGYIQLGGPTAEQDDVTGPVSYLVLEAAHRLRIPASVGVCVGEKVDRGLLRRGVEIMLKDRTGIPKFLGVDQTIAGFERSGFSAGTARERAYSGCHWSAVPGREYALMDCIKIDFAAILMLSWQEMLAGDMTSPSTEHLWRRFEAHLRRAVEVQALAIDFHVEHMHEVFPELVLDLLCHGPVERGLDASQGGVEFYTFGIDGAALATVADSFAAIEQRVEREGRLGWFELQGHLESDFSGPEGERVRLMLESTPHYGSGGSPADAWARKIASTHTAAVSASRTPAGYQMIPGLFSWANTISMGAALGATPNGRHSGKPISHGANPLPGFHGGNAPTALIQAVAGVQPGLGNTAPLQLDFQPVHRGQKADTELIMQLIETHFRLGGTQINLNLLNREQLLEANKNPAAYPDLVVRVTGFSAYFSSLSPDFRQLIVDRLVAGN